MGEVFEEGCYDIFESLTSYSFQGSEYAHECSQSPPIV
jgi:hypothetical protein